jgi:hypothetical protein
MDPSKQAELALAEYRALWDYYHRLFGEWTTLTDRYFKVVTLPGAAVAFLLIRDSTPIPRDLLVALLGLVFLIGVGLHVTYAKECGNANFYEACLERLRARLKDLAGLAEIGSLNEFRSRRTGLTFGGIKVWRGATIALLNSGVGTAALALAFDVQRPAAWVVKFIAFFVAHILLYHAAIRPYEVLLTSTSGSKE